MLLVYVFALLCIYGSTIADAKNVALVVGGNEYNGFPKLLLPRSTETCLVGIQDYNIKQLQSAEIFGCPGEASIEVADFPLISVGAAGIFWDSEQVPLVCGGVDCYYNDNEMATGNVTNQCFTFDAEANAWNEVEALLNNRVLHFMGQITSESAGFAMDPLVVGGIGFDSGTFVEVTKTSVLSNQAWQAHEHFFGLYNNYSVAFGDSCLAQIDNNLYQLSQYEATVTDLDTWTTTSIFPGGLEEPWGPCFDVCYCIPMEKDGRKGIYLESGAWLNIDDETFEALAEPLTYFSYLSSFNGLPTVFGQYSRTDGANLISNTRVEQYNREIDQWVVIGDLKHRRSVPTVVEIPESFCSLIGRSRKNATFFQ